MEKKTPRNKPFPLALREYRCLPRKHSCDSFFSFGFCGPGCPHMNTRVGISTTDNCCGCEKVPYQILSTNRRPFTSHPRVKRNSERREEKGMGESGRFPPCDIVPPKKKNKTIKPIDPPLFFLLFSLSLHLILSTCQLTPLPLLP